MVIQLWSFFSLVLLLSLPPAAYYYSCCDCSYCDYSNYNYYILLLRRLLPYYLLVDSGSKAGNAGTHGPEIYYNNIFFNIEYIIGMCWQGHAFGMNRVWIWYGSSSHTVWRLLRLASKDAGTPILCVLVEHG